MRAVAATFRGNFLLLMRHEYFPTAGISPLLLGHASKAISFLRGERLILSMISQAHLLPRFFSRLMFTARRFRAK